jgi:DNA-binding PadR family transcriptional regulator
MLTSLEAVTLAALADEPRYGYDLVQRISELTDGRMDIRPGNLYRVLDRLVRQGYVREIDQPSSDDERRRYFSLTARGARAAADELTMFAQVLRKVPSLKEAANHA